MPGSQLLIFKLRSATTHLDWGQAFSDISTCEVADLFQLRSALVAASIDTVLVTGNISEFSDALEILECVQLHAPLVPVVFWNTDMLASDAIRLFRCGAYDCLSEHSIEVLRCHILNAMEERRLILRSKGRAAQKETWRSFLVGESRAMEKVIETIRLVGPRRCTVLITGESGTGKEIAARALHMSSPRAHGPVVTVNCSALPEGLLEAELFGHVKGAFTGAMSLRIGRFEQAHTGTILLDEIGEMPLDLQAKLLRVLQEREFQRLGSSETIRVDLRIIAATNANLLERVRQGKFREDLFYRLNVVPMHMPSLSQRTDDIPLLVNHFLKKICQFEGIPLRRITPEVIAQLQSWSWPGNVRQLENAVEMAVAMSGEREMLYPADFGLSAEVRSRAAVPFPISPVEDPSDITDLNAALTQLEHSMLLRAMSKTSGNKTAAAELLGIKRTTLIMKLRTLEQALTA